METRPHHPVTLLPSEKALQVWGAMGFLLIGGIIYLLSRPTTLILFRVPHLLGWSNTIERLRESMSISLPEWVVFNLPDALWAGAYIMTIDSVTQKSSTQVRLVSASIVPTIGVVSEFLQAFSLLPGTFDPLDLLSYATPYIIYILITLRRVQSITAINKNIA